MKKICLLMAFFLICIVCLNACSNKTLLIAGEFESGNLLSGKVDIDLSTKFEKKYKKLMILMNID